MRKVVRTDALFFFMRPRIHMCKDYSEYSDLRDTAWLKFPFGNRVRRYRIPFTYPTSSVMNAELVQRVVFIGGREQLALTSVVH